MKLFLIILIPSMFILPTTFAKKSQIPKAQFYGDVFKHKKSMKIGDILSNPKKHESKHVQVQGKIKRVCPMAGCWVDLEDPKSGKVLHVKVKDGDIVFPKSSVGKNATIEGQLIEKKMSKKKAIKFYRHRAKELGKKFDPTTITGPMSSWELKGTAAKIKN